MIYKIDKDTVIDNHGYRTLKDNNPLNYEALPLLDISDIEIENALKYVRRLSKIQKCSVCSYGLKHNAERYLRADEFKAKEWDAYISNGALIVAMIKQGFKYKIYSHLEYPQKKDISINIDFNVAKKSL